MDTSDDRGRRNQHVAIDHRAEDPDTSRSDEHTTPAAGTGDGDRRAATDELLGDQERSSYRGRWDQVQAQFVDDPRASTEHAAQLVREAFDDLVERWRDHHGRLEDSWSGSDASTEELRTSMRRYRDELERLLRF